MLMKGVTSHKIKCKSSEKKQAKDKNYHKSAQVDLSVFVHDLHKDLNLHANEQHRCPVTPRLESRPVQA